MGPVLPQLPAGYLGHLVDQLERLVARPPVAGTAEAKRHRGWCQALTRVSGALQSARGQPPRSEDCALLRVRSLHRLAILGEARGWLDAGEAIVLRRLAFRLSFYLKRELVTPGSTTAAELGWLFTNVPPAGP